MLFKDYDQITYKIGKRTVTVSDIFRHITFDVQNSTPNAFYDYYIQDGETPESVSLKIYGSTAYSWLVLLINGLADRNSDWFTSQEQFLQSKELNYGGDAYYITSLPDIRPGDIMVKVTSTSEESATNIDATKYRIIKDFDVNLRKIRGITGSGTISSGDNILFARYNSEVGSVQTIEFLNGATYSEITDYASVIYTEKYGNSVEYFYSQPDADSKVLINPYKNVVNGATAPNVSTDTLYSNSGDTTTLENFTNTLLYKYSNLSGSGYGYFKKTIDETEFENYLDKQKIKVLRSEYLSAVVTAIKNALASDEIGKTFKVTI
jgi:hypothetical protein